jgi:hypothetical protein
VQILEHEHRRPRLGERLEKTAPGGDCFPTPVGLGLRARVQPDERAKVALYPVGFIRGDQRANRVRELRAGLVLRVRFQHARLCLDHLGKGPEADALAVGERPPLPPGDQLGILVDDPEQLVHEAALADAGDAHERHELRLPLRADACQRVGEQLEFARAPTSAVSAFSTTSTPKRERASSASHTGTGSALPFACTGSVSRYAIDRSVAR